MSFEEFIVMLESHYGMRYQTDSVELPLMKKFFEGKHVNFEDLLSRTVVHHSKKWKSLPDIAIMAEVMTGNDDALEAEALSWWNVLCRKANALNDILCEDIRVQQCIETFGGWQEFCKRDAKYESLHRKEFCRMFALFSRQPGTDQPKVLRGMMQHNSLAFIGDAEKCKQLMGTISAPKSELGFGNTLRQLNEKLNVAV